VARAAKQEEAEKGEDAEEMAEAARALGGTGRVGFPEAAGAMAELGRVMATWADAVDAMVIDKAAPAVKGMEEVVDPAAYLGQGALREGALEEAMVSEAAAVPVVGQLVGALAAAAAATATSSGRSPSRGHGA